MSSPLPAGCKVRLNPRYEAAPFEETFLGKNPKGEFVKCDVIYPARFMTEEDATANRNSVPTFEVEKADGETYESW